MTDTPNDIDVAIYGARLETAGGMYNAMVEAYRKEVLRALCDWADEFVFGAKTIRLAADVDWRWCLDGFLDDKGEKIDDAMEFGDYELGDVFSPAFLSELPDIDREGTTVIDIATCTFAPGTHYELAGRS
jgi:hypothetical protein